MNPHDVQTLPILAAMNLHPLRRRDGLVVQRTEVEEAFSDLAVKAVPLPDGRFIDAEELERVLMGVGLTVKYVKNQTKAYLIASGIII